MSHAAPVFALCTLLASSPLLAQGGGFGQTTPPDLAPTMEHPDDLSIARFAPWSDAPALPGQPRATRRNRIGAAGAIDIDGNGTKELWFVATDGPDAGRLAVQMARGADVRRYRTYPGGTPPELPTVGPVWTDAANYSDNPAFAPIMLVGPGANGPYRAVPTMQGTTPDTTTWTAVIDTDYFASGGLTYEIEAADYDGDDRPDLYTLSTDALLGLPATTVRKEAFPVGGVLPLPPRDLLLPTFCDTLRIADFDGDGVSDFAVHLPAVGVAIFVDTGSQFRFIGGLPLAAGILRDLVVGDVDMDGRDELAVVVADGVLLFAASGSGPTAVLDILRGAIPRPSGVGPLQSAAIVNGYGDPARELVLLPTDATSFAMVPWDPVQQDFTAPVLRAPPVATDYLGPGVWGQAAVCADLDEDGDDDLAVQTASGEWFTLAGPERDLTPIDVQVVGPPTPDPFFFVVDQVTVSFADSWTLTGATECEVSLYHRDPGATEFAHRISMALPLTTGTIAFPVSIRLSVPTSFPNMTLMTSGVSLMSVHLRNGNRRYASQLLYHDGDTGADGSAVGARWRLVATPPLPDMDDALLPWN